MDRKWWLQTLEWVTAVTAAAVLTALGSGMRDWRQLLGIGAAAAGATLVKCLAASRYGQGSPALVEPDPVVRVVSTAATTVAADVARLVADQARRQPRRPL